MGFRKPELTFVILLASSIFTTVTGAAEVNYELRVGGSYSDNIRRSDIGDEDQTIAIVGLNFDMSAESRRFEGSLAADIEYRDYLDDVFDNEEFSSAGGNAILKIAPDVFEWVFEDKFGVVNQDPFRPDTVENRENVNTFSTGPDLTLSLGGRTSVDLQARYRDSQFEISDSDNSGLSGVLSLVRALSPNRAISLNASADRIEFDNTVLNSSFDRQSAYLGFNSRISRGSLQVNLGVNELHDRGEAFTGTLASIAWNRDISPVSAISLEFNRQFSDAGDIFRRFSSLGTRPGDTGQIVPTADAFETQRLSVSYTYTRDKLQFSVSGFSSDDQYQNESEFDSRRTGVRIYITRDLGSGWAINANLRLERRRFDLSDREDDDSDAGLNIDRRLTRTLSLTLGYILADRSSDDASQDYSENQYRLLLRFRPRN